MISKLLSSAVKLYLRSQVERVECLKVQIVGRNKQILTGYIPQVFLSCSDAIYQGLHLSQVELQGADIAFNLPGVLKGEPLKLLEPVFVDLELKLSAADLQASLDSSLLQDGINDLWRMITATQPNLVTKSPIEWDNIATSGRELQLTGTYRDISGEIHQLTLSTAVNLVDSHTLCLSSVKIANRSLLTNQIETELKIDLGTDIAIDRLIVEPKQILCAGKIRINN